MNTPSKWNFDSMYPSVNSDKLKNDFNTFISLIEEINSFTEKELHSTVDAVSKITHFIKLVDNISYYYIIGNYLSLKVSANCNDHEAVKLLDKYEDTATSLTKPYATFNEFIKSIDNLDEIIASSSYLQEYSFFLKETKLNSKYSLTNEEEVIIDKLKLSGASSFEKLRDNTVSSLLIDITINGETKKLNFSEVRNLAYDKSEEVRKTAYLTELASYKQVDKTVATCLNSIKSWANTECELRGYDSILEKTLINSRMNNQTFNALLDAIKDNLPKLQTYFAHKGKLLGHKDGLPFYDLFASLGEVNYQFTYDEAREIIVKNFNLFNPEVGAFIDNAFEKGWIDAFPADGKRDGAFCSNIHQIKESRILSNFTGSFSDMSTLAHELGHAFHGDCLKNENHLNSDYPMPIAETASIFFETVIMDKFLDSANDAEKITLLDNSISDALQVLVDIYSRFIFEDNFINARKDGSLSTQEICTIMKDAQIKAYGDGLDNNYLHEYMWLAKPHYYSSDFNYYNFPYAFGLLFAKGVYSEYKVSTNKEEFYDNYKHLLAETGKNSLEDVAKIMNFDITKKDFWNNSIQSVISEIDEFIALTKHLV